MLRLIDMIKSLVPGPRGLFTIPISQTLEKKDVPSVLEVPFEGGRFAGAHHLHDRHGKRR